MGKNAKKRAYREVERLTRLASPWNRVEDSIREGDKRFSAWGADHASALSRNEKTAMFVEIAECKRMVKPIVIRER